MGVEGREGSSGSLMAEISVLMGWSSGVERGTGSLLPLRNMPEEERGSPRAGTNTDILIRATIG